jgi:fumarate reductase flavoprotein subunit
MSWNSEADVIVAGAGGAGLQAALAAGEAGARAVVFEKQARIWESSTAIAVGRVAFPCTDLQEKNGVKDSKELMARDILETGRHKNVPELVQAYVDNALDTYRQLSALGIKWSPTVTAMAGMSVPRGHLTDMIDLVRALRRAAESRGAEVVFQTPVTGLVEENGAVAGVTVRERDGRTSRVRARKGVVLASGGFARDPARLSAIEPRFAKVMATSGIGHTGDALRMAECLGADTRDTEYVQPSFELHASGGTSDDILILYYQGGIIVNAEGQRFVNESWSYKDIAKACLSQSGMMGWQVFDQTVYDKAVDAQQAAGQSSPMTLDANKIRLLVHGNTLGELAVAMRVPPAALEATVERYNRFIDDGRDADFGRATLAGNYGKPQKVAKGPFHAYATIGHLLATYGGIAVDAQMRVLKGGQPIPGLYAAGEAMGGFHGASYHSGTGVGKALIFGRIAGQNAAHRRT